MGLVKTRRLASMQKQQRAKAGMKPGHRHQGFRDIHGALCHREMKGCC